MRIVDFYHFSTNQWRRQGGGGHRVQVHPPRWVENFFWWQLGFPIFPFGITV